MKSYILTIEKRFPDWHKQKGERTNYQQLILTGHKIHTIRSKVEYWINILTKIQNMEGYLSLREWEGVPYESKSVEFLKVYEVGYELIQKINGSWTIVNTNLIINEFHLAENDGLNLRSLNYYYPNPNSLQMLIIHFTSFKYQYQIEAIKPPIEEPKKLNNQLNLNF